MIRHTKKYFLAVMGCLLWFVGQVYPKVYPTTNIVITQLMKPEKNIAMARQACARADPQNSILFPLDTDELIKYFFDYLSDKTGNLF